MLLPHDFHVSACPMDELIGIYYEQLTGLWKTQFSLLLCHRNFSFQGFSKDTS